MRKLLQDEDIHNTIRYDQMIDQSGQQSESPSRLCRGNVSGLRDPASLQTAADGSHLDRVSVRHATVPPQISKELFVAGGLCRSDLRADSFEPSRLLSVQRHRKYDGETQRQHVRVGMQPSLTAVCKNLNCTILYMDVDLVTFDFQTDVFQLEGGVVYANYGRPEDFNWLKSAGVSVIGCVVVMRVGGGVHLGSGDPFTPGFPSFNHTQFPPIQSSGLPLIPALPISATVAAKLLSQLSGPSCPQSWRGRLPYVHCVVGPQFSSGRQVKMAVHNAMTPVLLNNIFSSLEGRDEPDQYIILGAQRDSLGPGAVKSGIGTAILLELARTFTAMVKNGFSPRRSLLFVSWDAGDFGNVGATEWLEGYLSMLHLKAVAYFSLDQAVMGDDILSAYSSPLLVDLLDAAIRQVEHPKHAGQTIYSQAERDGGSWRIVSSYLMSCDVYSSVLPVLSVCVQERAYPFINTPLDSVSRLQEVLGGRLGVTGRSLGELVGEMVLRLAHDHILPLRITSYAQTVLQFSAQLNKHSAELQSRGLSPQWVFSARGDYSRAAETLQRAIDYSDLHDPITARSYNTRIIRVEYYFLSQYVSVVETPFRHVIHGCGDHTLSALTEHLALLTSDPGRFDEGRFRRQLALFTWTLQGAANALNGDVWNIHNTHTR
ncbi:hypothetical protein PAMP_016112 [Pampus punctatissimus]